MTRYAAREHDEDGDQRWEDCNGGRDEVGLWFNHDKTILARPFEKIFWLHHMAQHVK